MWLAVEPVPRSLWFRSRKKCKSDYGTWGLQKAYFQAHIIHCHGPTSFGMGEAKEVLSLQMWRTMVKKYSFNLSLFFFFFLFLSICQMFFIVTRKEGKNLHIYYNGKFGLFFHQYKTIAWDSYYTSSDWYHAFTYILVQHWYDYEAFLTIRVILK